MPWHVLAPSTLQPAVTGIWASSHPSWYGIWLHGTIGDCPKTGDHQLPWAWPLLLAPSPGLPKSNKALRGSRYTPTHTHAPLDFHFTPRECW